MRQVTVEYINPEKTAFSIKSGHPPTILIIMPGLFTAAFYSIPIFFSGMKPTPGVMIAMCGTALIGSYFMLFLFWNLIGTETFHFNEKAVQYEARIFLLRIRHRKMDMKEFHYFTVPVDDPRQADHIRGKLVLRGKDQKLESTIKVNCDALTKVVEELRKSLKNPAV